MYNNMYMSKESPIAARANYVNHVAYGGQEFDDFPNQLDTHVIGYIECKPVDKLPKVICCDISGAYSYWLFVLAIDAEQCKNGVPYLFKVTKVCYNRDDTPYFMVRPVCELSATLLKNERFGDVIAKSGMSTLCRPMQQTYAWDYTALIERLNLPTDIGEVDLCKVAVEQALAKKITFEEIVDLILLTKGLQARTAGGAEAANSSNRGFQTSTQGKKNRKRTCKGKKYKEPKQKGEKPKNSEKNGKKGKDNNGKAKKK